MKKLISTVVLTLFTTQVIFGQNKPVKQAAPSFDGSPHLFIKGKDHDTSATFLEKHSCTFCHEAFPGERVSGKIKSSELNEPNHLYKKFGDERIHPCKLCVKVEAPNGISAYCLSCHDGSAAMNRIMRQPGVTKSVTKESGSSVAVIDLFNTHPVSFVYDETHSENLWPINHHYNDTSTVRELLDENLEVQCTSCHNMHDPENPYLLRVDNLKSALCLCCHKR